MTITVRTLLDAGFSSSDFIGEAVTVPEVDGFTRGKVEGYHADAGVEVSIPTYGSASWQEDKPYPTLREWFAPTDVVFEDQTQAQEWLDEHAHVETTPRWLPARYVTCGTVVGIPAGDESIVGVVQSAKRVGLGGQIAIELPARTVIVEDWLAVEVCEL